MNNFGREPRFGFPFKCNYQYMQRVVSETKIQLAKMNLLNWVRYLAQAFVYFKLNTSI